LNNLLQLGPVFTPQDLSEVALELDDKERELMMSQGMDTEDAIKFVAEDSGRVDDSGNFSVEVLSVALERRFNITLSTEFNADAKAFILNFDSHWFTVRQLANGEYYDLNSLIPRPRHVTKFYLHAYLAQMKEEGYTLFIVKGDLPNYLDVQDTSCGSPADWCSIGGGEEPDFQSSSSATTTTAARKDPISNSAANFTSSPFEAFKTAGYSMTNSSQTSIAAEDDDEDDEQLREALALSLASNFPSLTKEEEDDLKSGPDMSESKIVRVQVILPDGGKRIRNFRPQSSCLVLYEYVSKELRRPKEGFTLSIGLPAARKLKFEDSMEVLFPASVVRVSLVTN
jgi:hypothetical protein